ncbi:hypothetical protein Dimus_016954 [Dionaea muscipula]
MGKREEFLVMVVALLVFMVGLVHITNADMVICGVDVLTLIPCQNAVSKSGASPPTKECCTALSNIPNIKCFCKYITSPILPLLGIDPHKALDLPVKCHLPSPGC